MELSLREPTQTPSAGGQSRARSRSVSGQSSHTTSIVYVVDDSGSMDGDFPEVRKALKDVRDTDMADTKVALIALGTNPTQVFGLTTHPADAQSRPGPWTDARINSFGGKLGGTYYKVPLENAKALLDADTTATTKRIIFLTDAQAPRPTAVVQAIQDAGIVVDTIGFGDHYSENFSVIQKIATDTGGVYRTVTKPSTGTTNTPAVTANSMTDILKDAVADNTATLFLVDYSFSVYEANEGVLRPALTAAATKAASGTNRKVGLAIFLGETTLFVDTATTPEYQKYQVVNAVGSSSLSMSDGTFYSTGSTDIDHALQQAYSTISSVSATSKRVVLITDGVSAVDVQDSTMNSYKNSSAVTLDVVAWGAHADRVKLKELADSDSGTFSVAKAAPAAPKSFTAWAGDTTLVLMWNDPSDSTITKYQYRHFRHPYELEDPSGPGRMSEWMDIPGTGPDTTFHILTGVPNLYVYYRLQIRTVRGEDTSGASSLGPYDMIRPVPENGIGLRATAGNGQIALSWTNPGGSITKYQYARSEQDGAWTDWMDISGSDANTISHTVTGLTNGTTYNIAVRAVRSNAHDLLSSVTATPTN